MVQSNHNYVIELTAREDGRLLRRFPVESGWESAQECVGFRASRSVGQLVPLSATNLCLEPLWEHGTDAPRTRVSKLTLVNQGAGAKVREVTTDGDIVWDYAYKDETDAPHMLFRAYRFPEDHPAIVGILEQAGN